MNNRITQLMKSGRSNLLSIYYTAGYPLRNDTIVIARALERAGADLLEIGIPFSDPVADGPVIQQSNTVAIKNGMTVALLLDQVRQLRREVQLPILLMGYINPLLQYGIERFLTDAAAAGADGLIIPDLPTPEFEKHYRSRFAELNLSAVFLIAPSISADRIKKIDSLSSAFVYAVSSSSTTGRQTDFSAEQQRYFERLQTLELSQPLLIGFGIGSHETFKTACAHARGAIVGSAFIRMLAQSTDFSVDIPDFIKTIRGSK